MAKIDSGRGGGETRDRRDGIDEAENWDGEYYDGMNGWGCDKTFTQFARFT